MLEVKNVQGQELIGVLNQIFDKTNKITGIVSAENPNSNIKSKIFIENGQISYATSTMYRARFGDLMIKKGIITPKELNSALKIQKENSEKPLIGSILVNMGVISERVIPNLLYHQIEVVIYEILTWENTNLFFEEYDIEAHPEYKRPVSKEDTKAAYNDLSKLLDSKAFVKNISDHVSELIKIRKYIGTPDNIPQKVSKNYPSQLNFDQRKILRSIDGINTLNDIIILSDLDYFRTYQIIYTLINENIISLPGKTSEIKDQDTDNPKDEVEDVINSYIIPDKKSNFNSYNHPENIEVTTEIKSIENLIASAESDKLLDTYREEIKSLKQKLKEYEESKPIFNAEITKKVSELSYNKKIILTNIIKNVLDMT